jgi:hypothetical protein
MRTYLLTAVILLSLSSPAQAQRRARGTTPPSTPDWVTGQGASPRFPTDAFLTGFGIAPTLPGETQERMLAPARQSSRKSLIEKVSVRIKSLSQLYQEEGKQDFFSVATQSYATLDLEGLTEETCATTTDGNVYAFAYVQRSKLAELYQQKVAERRRDAASSFLLGKGLEA